MEAEQSRTKVQMMDTQRQLPLMVTTQEIDSRFAQLRNQISILQLAQQALHAQFQEVARSFSQVSCQWQENQEMIDSMRSLLDQRPRNSTSSAERQM